MTESERREECIEDLNQQIGWIEGIKAHQFPGWGHAVGAMRLAIALLKAQEPVYIEERLVLDKLHTIQDYARVNEIHWMADGAAFAENVMNMLRGEINQFRKAHEPRLVTSKDFESNPNVDDMGNLPVWIEYRRDSYYENILKDCRDGWGIVSAQTIEDSHSMRCWTSRPADKQKEVTPWG